jgi:hypothetical protein
MDNTQDLSTYFDDCYVAPSIIEPNGEASTISASSSSGVDYDFSIPGYDGGGFGDDMYVDRALDGIQEAYVSNFDERRLMPIPWPAEPLLRLEDPFCGFFRTPPADDHVGETYRGLEGEILNRASMPLGRELASVEASCPLIPGLHSITNATNTTTEHSQEGTSPSQARSSTSFALYSRSNVKNRAGDGLQSDGEEEYHDAEEYKDSESDARGEAQNYGSNDNDRPVDSLPDSGIPDYSPPPTIYWMPAPLPSATVNPYYLMLTPQDTEALSGDYMSPPAPPLSSPISKAIGKVTDYVEAMEIEVDDDSGSGGVHNGFWDIIDWPPALEMEMD